VNTGHALSPYRVPRKVVNAVHEIPPFHVPRKVSNLSAGTAGLIR
jgi:hypothetical protein